MHALHVLAAAVLALAGAAQEPAPAAPSAPAPKKSKPAFETLTRTPKDGVTITADWYAPVPEHASMQHPSAVVVALHSRQSSRGEYRDLAPALVKEGLGVLAVDLRTGIVGAKAFDVDNGTAKSAAEKSKKPASPIDAYTDLVVAVAWARELAPDAKLVLLGSDASASLAIAFAAREVAGKVDLVLAYSPCECIEPWKLADVARALAVPVYVTSGLGADEEKEPRAIAKALPQAHVLAWFPSDELALPHGVRALALEPGAARDEAWSRLREALKRLGPVKR